uniref:(northern house mosquito) hypothetical protein n=1 Tax=Culex pipiens TaxID=7175 RepID=A0A8D8N6C4_CULPI
MLSVSKNRIAVSNLRLTLKKVALNKKEIFITTVLYFTVPHMFPNAVKSTNKKQNSKQAKKHFKYTIDGHFKTPNKPPVLFFSFLTLPHNPYHNLVGWFHLVRRLTHSHTVL